MKQPIELDIIHTEIFIEFIFAVKEKRTLISQEIRQAVQLYIADLLKGRGHKLLAIYCMPDHTHFLIDMNMVDSISALVDDIQSSSAAIINDQKWFKSEFSWQEGYATLSHSPWRVQELVDSILNQEMYHKEKTFKQEFIELLQSLEEDEVTDVFDWIL
jgi:putative transposase